MRVHHGDQHHVQDAAHRTAQLQDMHRLFQSKQDGPYRVGGFEFFHQVIGNIARREVGEDQGVHVLVHQFTERIILLHQFPVKGYAGLHFAIHDQRGHFFLYDPTGIGHEPGLGRIAAPEIGIAEHGDAGRDIEMLHLPGNHQCDISQFFRRGIEINGRIGEEQRTPFGQHQVHPCDLFHAFLGTDRMQGGTDRIGIVLGQSRDHRVGIAAFHHHATKIVAVLHHFF